MTSTSSPLFTASPAPHAQFFGAGRAGNPTGAGHATVPGWQQMGAAPNQLQQMGVAPNQLQQKGAAPNQAGPRVVYLGGRPVGSDPAHGYGQAPNMSQAGMMAAPQMNGHAQSLMQHQAPMQPMQYQVPMQQNLVAMHAGSAPAMHMQQQYPFAQQGQMQNMNMQPMAMNLVPSQSYRQ